MARSGCKYLSLDRYLHPPPLKGVKCDTGGGEGSDQREFHFRVELRFKWHSLSKAREAAAFTLTG